MTGAKRKVESVEVKFTIAGWLLRIYTVTVSNRTNFPKDPIRDLHECLSNIDGRQDKDYTLNRFGFAILHWGRRGDTIIIFHIGAWGDTVEVFADAFYRTLDGDHLMPHSSADPLFSIYDLPIVEHEVTNLKNALTGESVQSASASYFKLPPADIILVSP